MSSFCRNMVASYVYTAQFSSSQASWTALCHLHCNPDYFLWAEMVVLLFYLVKTSKMVASSAFLA